MKEFKLKMLMLIEDVIRTKPHLNQNFLSYKDNPHPLVYTPNVAEINGRHQMSLLLNWTEIYPDNDTPYNLLLNKYQFNIPPGSYHSNPNDPYMYEVCLRSTKYLPHADPIINDSTPSNMTITMHDTKYLIDHVPVTILNLSYKDELHLGSGGTCHFKISYPATPNNLERYFVKVAVYRMLRPDRVAAPPAKPMVPRQNLKQICDDLMLNQVRKSEDFKKELAKFMRADEDIILEKVIVSLASSITLTRIKIPVRGINCNHLLVDDLMEYLEVCVNSGKWLCKICKNSMKIEEMFIDEFYCELLKKDETAMEVEMRVGGSYSVTKVADDDSFEEIVIGDEGENKSNGTIVIGEDGHETCNSNQLSVAFTSRNDKLRDRTNQPNISEIEVIVIDDDANQASNVDPEIILAMEKSNRRKGKSSRRRSFKETTPMTKAERAKLTMDKYFRSLASVSKPPKPKRRRIFPPSQNVNIEVIVLD
uniref:SP-RING-type domain-containing protein n=1 Tax=Rhabditophanes sp. KR3021 TaxID=114890 RepID=A0AC35TIK0_9BILA